MRELVDAYMAVYAGRDSAIDEAIWPIWVDAIGDT